METLADIVKKYNPIGCVEDIVDYIKKKNPRWFKSSWETLGVIPLNNAGYPLGIEKVSEGNEDSCSCGFRKMFKLMFSTRKYSTATYFVVVHNHPSGNTEPSLKDISLTRNIIGAGKLLEFPLVDHIIISPLGSYYSTCRVHPDWFE